MTSDRRDPEALLLKANREEREKSGRGNLRLYLGAFPGVGKTYAMLNEAQRRRKYGEDVVVGFVETHRRAQTEAMLLGLEVIPRRQVAYKGVTVEEMDVDAIVRRRPAVALVDELAHTNAPGSEREKRYEDVDVLLHAGINVVSTLNVQHLESLNDAVAALTGVRVRETIPDFVVDNADEVILIDLSPEAARARMEHGNIYPEEQAKAALRGFFQPQNLAALREIALRRTAAEVDVQLDEYMRELSRPAANPDEHVLVYVDEKAMSRTLIRRGWRLAQGLHADLLVVYLRRDLDEKAQRDLARTIELAEDLNARIVPLDGADTAKALASYMKAEGVNHAVLPHQRRGALALKRPLADDLMAAVPNLDIHLVGDVQSGG